MATDITGETTGDEKGQSTGLYRIVSRLRSRVWNKEVLNNYRAGRRGLSFGGEREDQDYISIPEAVTDDRHTSVSHGARINKDSRQIDLRSANRSRPVRSWCDEVPGFWIGCFGFGAFTSFPRSDGTEEP
jgi:hypothetical protein